MNTVKLTCTGCNTKFDKSQKEYNRQIRNGRNIFYCSLNCSSTCVNKKRKKHINVVRKCMFCKNEFISTTHKRHKKCCSNECACKYSQTFVDNNNISNSLKTYFSKNPKMVIFENRRCVSCGNFFNIKKSIKRKTCDNKCYIVLLTNNSINNPNCGGETNFKKFKYNGIWMDSSWEVNIAKWLDKNQIPWKRDKKINFLWTDIDGKKRRYYPDFYLPTLNIYLDPKNEYKLEKDQYKLNQVIKENNINLIFGSENDIISKLNNLLVIDVTVA